MLPEDAPEIVSTSSLVQRVAGQIRDMIVQDELPPGARVRERALAARLNVSRTPLREALKILTTEGLVVHLPNRGAAVAAPGMDAIRDILRVLGTLEALAGEIACATASDAEIDEITALHHEMLAAYARKDRLLYFKLNQAIHRGLVAATRNPTLIELHGMVNARLYRTRYRSNLRTQKWHTAVEEHEAILAALRRRDGDELTQLLKAHLRSTRVKVEDLAAAEGGDTTASSRTAAE